MATGCPNKIFLKEMIEDFEEMIEDFEHTIFLHGYYEKDMTTYGSIKS